MSSLYEINQQLLAAIEMAEAGVEDVINAETGEVVSLADCLAGLQMAFEDKVEGCVLYMKNLKAEEQSIKAEVDALKKRAEAKAKRRERLEEYLKAICPEKQYESSKYCLKFRQSEVAVVPGDVSTLPTEYIKAKAVITADKVAIKKAIKGGKKIPGCSLEVKRNLSY